MATLFSQSLSGLIKALRNHKGSEDKVVKTALEEASVEARSTDWDVKAAAVLKLIYLEMLGHPAILTYSFNVLECMACPKFHIKQIGYLAASQSFGASTEVILLANNLIKKDLTTSSHPSTVILALTSLPSLLVASPQLAEDILPELLRMLTHSKPQVRRIATLTIGKIWCTSYGQQGNSSSTSYADNDNGNANDYLDSASAVPPRHSSSSSSSSSPLPIEFSHLEKLRSGLSDDDPSVVSATVNVMLELARSRQDSLQSLLPLAPELFDLLTNSSNNWMLIKIAKLFALLTPIEPRLVRKLLPPLTNLISTSPAFSLLYECIQTIITGGMLADADATTPLAQNCIGKLSAFLSDRDQNLRYIALKGLSRLLQNAPHTTPLLVKHYDDILACINEEDLTIRLKALELVERLTDRSNCKQIVTRLLDQIAPSSPSKKGHAPGLRSAAGALRAISSSYDTSSPSGRVSDSAQSTINTAATSYAVHQYRYRLLLLILRLTSRSSEDGAQLYVNITNFEWYIDTLITVAYLSLSVIASLSASESAKLAAKLSDCLLDVSARAASIRPAAIQRCRRLLADESFIALDNDVTRSVASACAFILGEYGDSDTARENVQLLVEAASGRSNVTCDVCLSAMQCLARWLVDVAATWREEELPKISRTLQSTREAILRSENTETALYADLITIVIHGLQDSSLHVSQKDPRAEHAVTSDLNGSERDNSEQADAFPAWKEDQPFNTVQTQSRPPESLYFLYSIFSGYELRPLAANAQALVARPDELNLDETIGSPAVLEKQADRQSHKGVIIGSVKDRSEEIDEYGRPRATAASTSYAMVPASSEERFGEAPTKKQKKSKKRSSAAKGNECRNETQHTEDNEVDDIDNIPIVKLDLSNRDEQEGASKTGSRSKGKESSRRKGSKLVGEGEENLETERVPSPPPLILTAGGDAPVPVSRPSSARPATANTPTSEAGILVGGPAAKESSPQIRPKGASEEMVGDTTAVKVIKKKKRKKAKEGLKAVEQA